MKQNKNQLINSSLTQKGSLLDFYHIKRSSGKQPSHPNDQFKQSKIINESTNHTSNHAEEPQERDGEFDENSQNAIGFMQAKFIKEGRSYKQIRAEAEPVAEQSVTNPKKLQKRMVFDTDEEPTIKVNDFVKAEVNKVIDKEAVLADTAKKTRRATSQPYSRINFVEVEKQMSLSPKFMIPPNKKIEKILTSQPPRQKWSHLLKSEDKYDIGFDHRNLLRVLRAIDSTINFLRMESPVKKDFFTNLKRRIREGMNITITKKHIQQLLFINDELFKIEWAENASIKDFDLLIILPRFTSEDARVKDTRKRIVHYLIAMEIEYLEKHPEFEKENCEKWAQGFDPNTCEIPIKLLPSHPTLKNAQIRNMTRQEINKVSSVPLKQMFMKKKDKADSQSRVSDDIVRMVFEKQSNMSIKEKLYHAIKEKEQAIEAKKNCAFPLLDIESLLQVIDEVMIIYTGKNVSNIPKATLIDIIDRKLPLKVAQITECIKSIVQAKEVLFLKEVVTSSKMLILQLDRTKYNSMRDYAKRLKLE